MQSTRNFDEMVPTFWNAIFYPWGPNDGIPDYRFRFKLIQFDVNSDFRFTVVVHFLYAHFFVHFLV